MLNTPSSSPLPPRLKRGGQPANQNARKFGTYSLFRPGHLSSAHLLFQNLRLHLNDPACPLDQTVERAQAANLELLPTVRARGSDLNAAVRLICNFAGLVSRAYSYITPAVRLSNALEAIAQDPFDWFARGYKDCGISRDADSFFPVSKKSALNSPLPADHPTLATNLTDSQWAVLAPLIPPDPHLDWLILPAGDTGEPPVIIAANRWGFTQYYSTGEINDLVIMENYHQVLQRFSALCVGQGNSDGSREGSHDSAGS